MFSPIWRSTALAAGLLAMAHGPAFAADTPEPARTVAAKDRLAEARQLIAAKQYPAAVDALKRVNDTGSADWHNLMGFSLRKGPSPDLAAAEKHYDEALRIDPKHKGALEYSGELFLMKGDLGRAEGRVASLEKLCSSGCDELNDLRAAVQRYKMAGNKFVVGGW